MGQRPALRGGVSDVIRGTVVGGGHGVTSGWYGRQKHHLDLGVVSAGEC